jgi:hypothetical protein
MRLLGTRQGDLASSFSLNREVVGDRLRFWSKGRSCEVASDSGEVSREGESVWVQEQEWEGKEAEEVCAENEVDHRGRGLHRHRVRRG